jgi:LacI family transcriptional regulator
MIQGWRRPTLKDVSGAARVSTFTVSRALGRQSGVSAETRERVFEAARALGYVPNRLARSLKHADSQMIGVLVSNNANPFFATLVRSLENVVQKQGFQCFVLDAEEDGEYRTERETLLVAALLEQRVAGIALTYVPTAGNMEALAKWRVPLVFVDCVSPPGYEGYPSVTADNWSASHNVGLHFARLAYRGWVFVGHTRKRASRKDRERGFGDAARACGASLRIVEGANDRESAYRALRAMLSDCVRNDLPDAVLASNELLLHGSLRAIREVGLRIPDDIAVVGFDEFIWAELVDPPMTVVDQHIDRIGGEAGRLLLGEIAGGPEVLGVTPKEPLLVRADLKIRRSCGAAAFGSAGRAA